MNRVLVTTVAEAQFRKWSWWSNWIDITVYGFGSDGYLLQMSVSRTNSKKFRSRPLQGLHRSCSYRGDLTQMDSVLAQLKRKLVE